MNFADQDIPRFFTALAEWGSCMIFISLLEKRLSKGRAWAFSMLALALQSVFLVATDDLSNFFWAACMLVAVGQMWLFLWGSCRLSFLESGYCCASAFLIAEFAASLEWQIHAYFIHLGMKGLLWHGAVLCMIYGALFLAMRFMVKQIYLQKYLVQLTKRELFSAVILALAVFVFSNLSFLATSSPFIGRVKSDIFFIRTLVDFAGVAIMYAFQTRICEYITEKEVASIRSMLEIQYDQYRNYLDNMELIHIKYHDLKHQIAGLRAETDIEKRKEWLDAMEHEIENTRLADHTGNQVLDAILGAKLMQARKNKIQITCVADGTLLDFIHVTDLCTIFGNALDNAIESVVMLPDEERRLIHVSVVSRNDFVFIQIANYCEQRLVRGVGKMPETTKADKKNHGFGLKSIQYSVEKYKGSIAVDVKNNWFELRVLIPKEAMA